MDKGISTVIAVILMLIIVIALSVTAYTIMSGTLTSITSTSFSIIDVINDTVVIQNLGEAPRFPFYYAAFRLHSSGGLKSADFCPTY